jgi:hypothetical protein
VAKTLDRDDVKRRLDKKLSDCGNQAVKDFFRRFREADKNTSKGLSFFVWDPTLQKSQSRWCVDVNRKSATAIQKRIQNRPFDPDQNFWRARLSCPSSVKPRNGHDLLTFHLESADDFGLFEGVLKSAGPKKS